MRNQVLYRAAQVCSGVLFAFANMVTQMLQMQHMAEHTERRCPAWNLQGTDVSCMLDAFAMVSLICLSSIGHGIPACHQGSRCPLNVELHCHCPQT